MREFVLFGDSLTEWSFSEETQGFGLFLRQQYQDKVRIVNEGRSQQILYDTFQILLRHCVYYSSSSCRPTSIT